MREEWHSFLVGNGAHIHGNHVLHFGDPKSELAHAEGNLIADISHYGLISASGSDTAAFLQGQLTNDVRAIDESRSQLTGYCTPKGRLLALFRLFRCGDAYFIRLPAELTAPVVKRLRMYILRSNVVLEDASDHLVRFGIAGPDTERTMREVLGSAPVAVNSAVVIDGVAVLRLPSANARFELHGPAERMQALWQQLSAHAKPVGAAVWSLLDIRAGVPQVLPATSESFVPQMINLHALHGVSFHKGCYTGQEIVARMQYLGKLKRRMYLAHVSGTTLPLPGDELYAPSSESGQGTGKIVDAQPSPKGGYDLLAVIEIAAVDADDPIHVHDSAGPVLQILELPYAVDDFASAPNND